MPCQGSCRNSQRLITGGGSPKAIKRSSAALMMSIDIQIAIWLAGRSLGRARSLGCRAASSSRAGAQPRPGQIAWILWGLIRPAFSVEHETLERLGLGLPLHDLDLGAGLAVSLAVRRARRRRAVGRCAGRRHDDGATTSSGSRPGLPSGGGLPAVYRGHPMLPPSAAGVSFCHPLHFRCRLPSLGRRLHCCRMHTLRASRLAGRAGVDRKNKRGFGAMAREVFA